MERTATHCGCAFVINHKRAVAQPCVNGDRLSQWRMAKFDPSQIRDLFEYALYKFTLYLLTYLLTQPIDTKFETSDYVRKTTPCAKFCANPFTGGFTAKRWNITEFFKFPYTFFNGRHTGHTGRRIFTRNGSNNAVLRKGVLFRGRKFKVNI